MLTLYVILFCRENPLDEVSPSELIHSVDSVGPADSPPNNNTGPPSPSTAQHMWLLLPSIPISWTEVGVKAYIGFNLRQDLRSQVRPQQPPQRRSPQRLWKTLFPSGRSARRQVRRVWGLKTSTTVPVGKPPVMMTPGTKCTRILVKTIIHWQH